MQVPIIKIRPGAQTPEYHSSGAAAFDLASAENLVVKPGQLAKVPTGLVIQTPPGHFMLIAARSSLAVKKGLMLGNGVGVLDSDYTGPEDEVLILVYNFTQADVEIKAGERLAQGIFFPIDHAEFIEGEHKDTSRGGFGHSGGYNV